MKQGYNPQGKNYKRPDRLIFFDLDGVLADYNALASQYGYLPNQGAGRVIPGFYRELDLYPGAKEFVLWVEDQWPGSVRFCTACSLRRPEGWGEKAAWIVAKFPELQDRLIVTRDKSACGTEWDILIDDNPQWAGAKEFPGKLIPFDSQNIDWVQLGVRIQEWMNE